MVDLHTHSYYSDGTVSPAEVVRLASEAGLTAAALCDHNTVAGLPEFLQAAAQSGLEGVPGVEVSTDYGNTELHIVGLYLRPESYAPLTDALEEMLRRKQRSNRELVAALREAGLAVDYETIRRRSPDGFVNRATIAAELVRLGCAESVRDAFSRWLRPEHGYFHPPRRLDAVETIRLLKSLGAAAVLAHPLLSMKDEAALRGFLELAVPAGLDAMETRYSTYDEPTQQLASAIAREYGLLESGGSDFHGENKPDIRVGTGRGTLCVPDLFLERIRASLSHH